MTVSKQSNKENTFNGQVLLTPHMRFRRFLVRKFHRILESRSLSKQKKWHAIKRVIPFLESQQKAASQHKWIQLAGHEDSFAFGDEGTILKKLQNCEKDALEKLMVDALQPYVPFYNGIVNIDGTSYIEMQDLLYDFTNPCVMDCKMGTRTYLEEELKKLEEQPEPRRDMYEKMIKVDPYEPTEEEHANKSVTKPRYMQWREKLSSSETMGFRIEGIKNSAGETFVDFKQCRDKESVVESLLKFTGGCPHIISLYLQRLKSLRSTFTNSQFSQTHEIIGSSLLFVHDEHKANIWMIDFGKTSHLNGQKITHTEPWVRGNREDGYLTGVNNMVEIFEDLLTECHH